MRFYIIYLLLFLFGLNFLYSQENEIYKRTRDNNSSDFIIFKEDTVVIIIQNRFLIGGIKTDSVIDLTPLSFERFRINKIEHNPKEEAKLVIENLFKESFLKSDTNPMIWGHLTIHDSKNDIQLYKSVDKVFLDKNTLSFPLYFTDLEKFKIRNTKRGKTYNMLISHENLPDTIFYDYMEFVVPISDGMSIGSVEIRPHETVYTDLYLVFLQIRLIELKTKKKMLYYRKNNNLIITYSLEFAHHDILDFLWNRKIVESNTNSIYVSLSKIKEFELSEKERDLFDFAFMLVKESLENK